MEALGVEYTEFLATLATSSFAACMLCVTALCAFIGSLTARRLLKKHF